MEIKPIKVEVYSTVKGITPLTIWLHPLKDLKAQAAVFKRIRRLELGLLGDFKYFDHILELRIDYGPGYRIYCGKKENTWIILLLGGTKRTQDEDIRTAQEYWKDWQKRNSTKRSV
jgi:putative addiction module killer protein